MLTITACGKIASRGQPGLSSESQAILGLRYTARPHHQNQQSWTSVTWLEGKVACPENLMPWVQSLEPMLGQKNQPPKVVLCPPDTVAMITSYGVCLTFLKSLEKGVRSSVNWDHWPVNPRNPAFRVGGSSVAEYFTCVRPQHWLSEHQPQHIQFLTWKTGGP